MIFDPFGDFARRGYLRNKAGLKDPSAVRNFEHVAFIDNLPEAVDWLKSAKPITYQAVLDTHRILFQDVYPWAGQDRQTTAPRIAIAKGGRDDLFAHPRFIQDAVHYALKLGNDSGHMAVCPGEVMGYLAHAHPFLDGNGRTLMVVHNELAYRAGISVDWAKTDQDAYLAALTHELDRPGKGQLDAYLKPFIGRAISRKQSTEMLATLRALKGRTDDP